MSRVTIFTNSIAAAIVNSDAHSDDAHQQTTTSALHQLHQVIHLWRLTDGLVGMLYVYIYVNNNRII